MAALHCATHSAIWNEVANGSRKWTPPFVCPVYNRAMEILGEPLRERCVDPYDITPQRQTWQRWDAWK
jgi:hypothetical protein